MLGKISGAVGVYSAQSLLFPDNPAALEKAVLARLGLKSTETQIASQIVEPEPFVDLGYAAISLFSVLANLADDMRHLMRTEIAEVTKKTMAGHVGSSTMPHKVNPKDFENVKSLWKAYMPRIVTLLSDQISEHQRDLTNSASGRFITELLGATAYGVIRTRKALSAIRINEEGIQKNLDKSKNQFVAEPLYIVLSANGIHSGYELMRRAAREAREAESTVAAILKADEEFNGILAKLPEKARAQLNAILERPETYTGLAEASALKTCDFWERKLEHLKK
jgi:adenylosuccinate lyase